MYYVYMLRCEDNSLYTGITTDVERRMKEHFSKGKKCAKYTFRHTPKKLETYFEVETRSIASKLEYHIKTLKKEQKEQLINNKEQLKDFLGEKYESIFKEKCEKRNIKNKLKEFYDETVEYLDANNELDNWTYNKAIQKAIESYRITEEQKENLRKMKKK